MHKVLILTIIYSFKVNTEFKHSIYNNGAVLSPSTNTTAATLLQLYTEVYTQSDHYYLIHKYWRRNSVDESPHTVGSEQPKPPEAR